MTQAHESERTNQDHSATSGESDRVSTSRRAALAKLGLAVGAAYVAPTVLRIDRSARAQAPSGNGNGPGKCTPGQAKKGLC